jgi:hypothetical protein
MFAWPDSWFNFALAKQPLNWLVVGVIATIWLIAFHVIMSGFTSMQGGAENSGQAPGTSMSPQVGGSGVTQGAEMTWTDDFEAKWVGDGWLGNS